MTAGNAEISPQAVNADLEVWERHLETEVEKDPGIADAEREALIVAAREGVHHQGPWLF